MIAYPWTLGSVEAFEMRVTPNVTTFTSPYSKSTQTVDFLGEKWYAKLDLPAHVDEAMGSAREAFFDRLRGQVNLVTLWNLKRPIPRGTFRGGNLTATTTQLSNILNIGAATGTTLLAGDMVGCSGQLFRALADATANAQGVLQFEVAPRARFDLLQGAAVTWNKPTANFMVTTGGGVPTVWRMGMFDGTSIDLVEVP